MARSNENVKFKKVITPITNCRWYQCALYLSKGSENLNCKMYFGLEPNREVFPDDESYNVALDNWNKNMADFEEAEDSREIISKSTKEHVGYEYFVDLTDKKYLEKSGNIRQTISGRLINFYPHMQDTLQKNGEIKSYWVVELLDETKREKYTLKVSVAIKGRELIDKICNLTTEQLKNPIEISLNLYEAYGRECVDTGVKVLDNTQYGTKVESFYEFSDWNDKSKKKVLKSKGTKSDNKEFAAAFYLNLEKKFAEAEDLFKTFYSRISLRFQQETLIPVMTEYWKSKGWDMEIKDKIEDKQVKKGRKTETVTEKTREVIYLTPIAGTNKPNHASTVDDNEVIDDMPF